MTDDKNSKKNINLDKIQQQLDEADKKAAEYLDGWQRARAASQNEAKLFASNLQRSLERNTTEVMENILPIFDGLDIACSLIDKDDNSSVAIGLRNIQNKITKSLEQMNIKECAKINDEFSPDLHECVEQVEVTEEKQENKILFVLRQGYILNKNLIRPAQVKIGILVKNA